MTDEANAIEKSALTSCHFYLSPFIYVYTASSGSSFPKVVNGSKLSAL